MPNHIKEPDDPANPDRKRPPSFKVDPDDTALYKIAAKCATQIPVIREKNMAIPDHLRAFHLYCFLAETGKLPSEVCIQEITMDDGRNQFWFMPISAAEPLMNEIHRLRARCEDLAAKVDSKERAIKVRNEQLVRKSERIVELERRVHEAEQKS